MGDKVEQNVKKMQKNNRARWYGSGNLCFLGKMVW